jgi:chemotaxis protein methyltransferase CheR
LADLQSLAHSNPSAAYPQCLEALSHEPHSAELHYLEAVFLLALDRVDEAAAAVRQALYLDRSLAMGHFLLGVILQRQHDPEGACRAYRNAAELCLSRPADEIVPLSEGESAGNLAAAAAAHQALLAAVKDGAV